MKRQFYRSSLLPVSAGFAQDWVRRADQNLTLVPPWERDAVVDSPPVLPPRQGPLRSLFSSFSLKHLPKVSASEPIGWGPFDRWSYEAEVADISTHECEWRDALVYRLSGGRLGDTLLVGEVEERLDRLFSYRHTLMAATLPWVKQFVGVSGTAGLQKIVVTGASGLIGSELCYFLESCGYPVVRLSRHERPGYVGWNPQEKPSDRLLEACQGAWACVHLAGENIAQGRWTAARKESILQSRILAAKGLMNFLKELKDPPSVVVCSSGINAYGDRGNEVLNDDASFGTGFLAEVVQAWERELFEFSKLGSRVVALRLGMVLSGHGGALAPLVKLFKSGLGGAVGHGGQWMPWVALHDVLGVTLMALHDSAVKGALNVVSPALVQNVTFSKGLAQVLNRPCLAKVPGWGAKLALGEMAQELVLSSIRALPSRLVQLGFPFAFDDLRQALRFYLGQRG